MPRIDVRRLAAVDMYGAHGTQRRRRIIVAEFVLGAVVGTAIGVAVAVAAGSLGWRVFGAWIAGACLNYVPLAAHALDLSRPGRLASELEGVDVPRELRHYTKAQFWIAVPLLFLVLAARQAPRAPGR
ncbi:MAG TPA: hypothetical protein VFM41_08725 [Gaiella sp.]|jgi:hypothetical protein|nr:hypothetical protein [Gaiella sp.]